MVSASDPEAALGRDKYNVFRPLYNVQLVRDLDSQLCLGYQVFAQPTDAGTFGPMLERIANWTGVKPKAMLVDAGYVTACNLAICDQAGIALYGPWQENDFSQKKKKPGAKPRPIGKEHFTWVPEQNMYRCPEGHPMPWIGHQKRRQSDGQINVVHSYRCSPQHCRACPRQVLCSSNPNRGRAVKRSEHEALVEAHRTRMATAEAKASTDSAAKRWNWVSPTSNSIPAPWRSVVCYTPPCETERDITRLPGSRNVAHSQNDT